MVSFFSVSTVFIVVDRFVSPERKGRPGVFGEVSYDDFSFGKSSFIELLLKTFHFVVRNEIRKNLEKRQLPSWVKQVVYIYIKVSL